jgi:cyclomaltodextrinase / maltogenic alpha-amylase / neopullulanase
LSMLGGDKSRLRLATLFQMTYPGAPCVYYGNEIGMQGGKDPDCRRSFPWELSRWDQDLLAYFKHLIALRKQHRSLRDGSYQIIYAQDGLVAILRQWQEEKAVVVFNRRQASLHFELEVTGLIPDGSVFFDELNQTNVRTTSGKLGLNVPPMSGALLVSKG